MKEDEKGKYYRKKVKDVKYVEENVEVKEDKTLGEEK